MKHKIPIGPGRRSAILDSVYHPQRSALSVKRRESGRAYGSPYRATYDAVVDTVADAVADAVNLAALGRP